MRRCKRTVHAARTLKTTSRRSLLTQSLHAPCLHGANLTESSASKQIVHSKFSFVSCAARADSRAGAESVFGITPSRLLQRHLLALCYHSCEAALQHSTASIVETDQGRCQASAVPSPCDSARHVGIFDFRARSSYDSLR